MPFSALPTALDWGGGGEGGEWAPVQRSQPQEQEVAMEEFLKIVFPSASELLHKNSGLKLKEGEGEDVVQRLREHWRGCFGDFSFSF